MGPVGDFLAPCTKKTWPTPCKDKLLSSIQDPSYEFQSGGKKGHTGRVIGPELPLVSAGENVGRLFLPQEFG